MTSKRVPADPVIERLDSILTVLENLLILEGAKAGVMRDDLRPLVGVSNERLSAVMRHVRPAKKSAVDA
jgi:hypothetical protein